MGCSSPSSEMQAFSWAMVCTTCSFQVLKSGYDKQTSWQSTFWNLSDVKQSQWQSTFWSPSLIIRFLHHLWIHVMVLIRFLAVLLLLKSRGRNICIINHVMRKSYVMTKLKKAFEDLQPWMLMRTELIFISQQSYLQRSSGVGYLERWISAGCQGGGKQGPPAPAGSCWPCLECWLLGLWLMGLPGSTKTVALSLQVCCRKVKPMDWGNPHNIKSPSLAVSVGKGSVGHRRNLLIRLWVSLTSPSNVSPADFWFSLAVCQADQQLLVLVKCSVPQQKLALDLSLLAA